MLRYSQVYELTRNKITVGETFAVESTLDLSWRCSRANRFIRTIAFSNLRCLNHRLARKPRTLDKSNYQSLNDFLSFPFRSSLSFLSSLSALRFQRDGRKTTIRVVKGSTNHDRKWFLSKKIPLAGTRMNTYEGPIKRSLTRRELFHVQTELDEQVKQEPREF